MIQCCNLVKAGYGTLKEIQELDSPEFLDLMEYEDISTKIYQKKMDDARA